MKRRKFLIALGAVTPLVLQACLSDPVPPTIFTGFVTDENGKPIKDFTFYFNGNTGGFSPKSTFDLNTKSDENGYYYLEKIVDLKQTVSVDFIPGGNTIYNTGQYEFLCLVKGIYQTTIPFSTGVKNEFNFKIVKRK